MLDQLQANREKENRPSAMQREFDKGDPDGKVRAYADQIIEEMKQEGKWE